MPQRVAHSPAKHPTPWVDPPILVRALCLLAMMAAPARGAVPGDPYLNGPVCISPGLQLGQGAVSDGFGGAYVAWDDQGNFDGSCHPICDFNIFVQHLLPSGWADPAFPVNGLAVCTAPNVQNGITVTGDGAGGAFIAWWDNRSGTNSDIYAQHVLPSGTVDPAWPVNGLGVCTLPSFVDQPAIASDGAGGAIVSWVDTRSGNSDIYAQHILASGVVDGTWPVGGRALTTAANTQFQQKIVSDGAGGAFVTFADFRSGVALDIYAQHVLASGITNPAWPPDGLALCTATGSQSSPLIVSGGSGGAIVTWTDTRSGNSDAYAQHVLPTGVDATWPVNGLGVCVESHFQSVGGVVSDGAGGAIVGWSDNRGAFGYSDIYAQHVLASGAVDPAWPADGQVLCSAPNNQGLFIHVGNMAPDGSGGAIVAWEDQRTSRDIYAQHVLASGAVDPAWPVNGRAISIGQSRERPMVVESGVGAAIIAWSDGRVSTSTHPDLNIYSQRVEADGSLGPNPYETITASAGPGGAISPSGAIIVLDGGEQTFTITPSACTEIADVLVDGHSLGAVSSYTYTSVTTDHTIVATFTPCVQGTITGQVTAQCPTAGTALLGVTVDAFAMGSGDLLGTAVTDANGDYTMANIPAIEYTITLLTPLGYSAAMDEVPVTLPGGGTVAVNFDLTCIASSGDPNSSGFWKHQVGIATGGNGNPQVDAAALCGYLDMIEAHFNNNALNQVVVYDPAAGSTCAQKLEIAKGLLNLGGSPAPIDKARQQLLSLLLNVAGNYLGLQEVVSKDGATASQAITYCDQLIDNPTGDHTLAAAIAEKINSGQKVNAGVIPLGTQNIAYARDGKALDFTVHPNPGGDLRTFSFLLDAPGRVSLGIYDVSGRRLASIYEGALGAGRQTLRWDGRVAGGAPLKQGLYFARLVTGAGAKVVRLVQAAP